MSRYIRYRDVRKSGVRLAQCDDSSMFILYRDCPEFNLFIAMLNQAIIDCFAKNTQTVIDRRKTNQNFDERRNHNGIARAEARYFILYSPYIESFLDIVDYNYSIFREKMVKLINDFDETGIRPKFVADLTYQYK